MNSMLMRGLMIGLTALSVSLALSAQVVVSSGFEQLDRWASECLAERSMTLGYPGNNDIRLEEFYRWYTGKPALIPLASAVINSSASTALADSSSQPATFTTISQPTTSLI